MRLLKQLGFSNAQNLSEKVWDAYGYAKIDRGGGDLVTQSVQSWHRQMRQIGAHERDVKDATAEKPGFKNFVARRLAEQYENNQGPNSETKTGSWDNTLIGSNTPVIFDPDVYEVLTREAPALAEIPMVGNIGFKAVVNRIDSRDEPIGFMTEADSLDLSDDTESQVTFGKLEEDVKIWADLVDVSDFSTEGTAHYPGLAPLRETALGSRLAEAFQHRETAVLYGDPGESADDDHSTVRGSIFSTNGYRGLQDWAEDAGNSVDKSAVSSNFGEDIKSEIVDLEQSGNNVSRSDMIIITSHTMADALENEVEGRRRYQPEDDTAVFGFAQVRIGGVRVIPTHNVTQHSYGAGTNEITAGDEGDVFITTTRAAQLRQLAPLMTVPLAKVGLAERAAMAEFATFVERANGNHTKHLSAYNV